MYLLSFHIYLHIVLNKTKFQLEKLDFNTPSEVLRCRSIHRGRGGRVGWKKSQVHNRWRRGRQMEDSTAEEVRRMGDGVAGQRRGPGVAEGATRGAEAPRMGRRRRGWGTGWRHRGWGMGRRWTGQESGRRDGWDREGMGTCGDLGELGAVMVNGLWGG